MRRRPARFRFEGTLYKEHVVTVAVPAYNEERLITTVISTMPDFVDQIVVVDDCSTDSTYETVQKFADKRTILMKTGQNRGVGGATVLGYKKALELESDIVVKMDGDAQMRSEYLGQLLDPLIEEDYSYTKGNRFLLPEFLVQMPRGRLLGNVALTFMTKLASGYWHIFDPQNGFTAIKTDALRRLNLAELHQRFFFENDMLYQLNLQNARVKDVAIPSKYGEEVSSLSLFRVAVTFPFLLLRRFTSRITLKYVLRDFSPIALFLILGTLLFGWGVLFGAYAWIRSALTDDLTSTGTVMLSVLPLILGFQLILQAIVLDIAETPK
jgi:glycosyltransferase involved in cell wall biosynthesis